MTNFQLAVLQILNRGGIKGYNTALREICRNLPHALGEIIYKVVRYHAKRDPQDLVKIAAWAQLEWEAADVNDRGSGAGDTPITPPARPADQGPRPGVADSRTGDFGSDSRGSRRVSPTTSWGPADIVADGFTVRASPGRRSRKPVDNKHRRGKGKRTT